MVQRFDHIKILCDVSKSLELQRFDDINFNVTWSRSVGGFRGGEAPPDSGREALVSRACVVRG